MSRSVTGTLPDSVEVLLDKLEKFADKNNIHFEGDSAEGQAKGKGFNIKYHVTGDQCTLTVTKKPLLVPWSVIEAALAKVLQ